MTSFSRDDNLRDAVFTGVDLRGARFVESDLSEVVLRGVEVAGMDIDAPWLVHGGRLLVNGVDVIAFVESTLNKRFPGREQRRADDPDGLRAAWAALEVAWASALARVASLPPGSVDISVAGEWTFAQTLRHLIFATDLWLGRAVLHLENPVHPLGQMDAGTASDGTDTVVGSESTPSYGEVLAVRAQRVERVRDFLASTTPDDLATEQRNPHDPDVSETTLSCLHVILEEEWEHLRFATRDLDAQE
jgi:DinB superfamily/Pentapeptide repeats (8 copies)